MVLCSELKRGQISKRMLYANLGIYLYTFMAYAAKGASTKYYLAIDEPMHSLILCQFFKHVQLAKFQIIYEHCIFNLVYHVV